MPLPPIEISTTVAVNLLERLEPRYPEACAQLVYVFAALAEQEEPLSATSPRPSHSSRRVNRLNPQLAEGHYQLGRALQARGDIEGAKKAYQRAVELAPDAQADQDRVGGDGRCKAE